MFLELINKYRTIIAIKPSVGVMSQCQSRGIFLQTANRASLETIMVSPYAKVHSNCCVGLSGEHNLTSV